MRREGRVLVIESTPVPSERPARRGAGGAPRETAVLVVQLADRRLAIPSAVVERVLPMAELTPLPDPPPGIVGLLNVAGATLPVVDPRPRLGLSTPAVRPDQHLVLVAAPTPYLLWVDRVETLTVAPVETLAVGAGDEARGVARLGAAAVPLLAVDRLAPAPAAAARKPV